MDVLGPASSATPNNGHKSNGATTTTTTNGSAVAAAAVDSSKQLSPTASDNANGGAARANGSCDSRKKLSTGAERKRETYQKLSKIVDVTIAYEKGQPLNLLNIITAVRPPCITHVHYRIFDIKDVSILFH